MSFKVTFGCGAFLPGLGPGNVPQFDGGGTIDSGGGNDPPDSDPPDPGGIDPDPTPDNGGGQPPPGDITPTPGPTSPGDIDPSPGGAAPPPPAPDTPTPTSGAKHCRCMPNLGSPVSERVDRGIGGRSVSTYTVTRVYSQTCTEFPTRAQADLAVNQARQIARQTPAPPNLGGEWVLVSGPTISGGPIGKRCNSAAGCGGACPNITITSTWRRKPLVIGPPPPGPGEVDPPGGIIITPGPGGTDIGPGGSTPPPPGPGNGITPGGSAGETGGAGPPPAAPGNPGGPGGAGPVPPGPGDEGISLCIIINDSPTPNEFIISGGDAPAGATHSVVVIFPQSCFEGLDPGFAETARQRNTDIVSAASTQAPSNFSGPWIQVGVEVEGEVNASCANTDCGPITVRTYWKRLEDDPGPDIGDADGVSLEGEGGSIGFSTEGPGAGQGLADTGIPNSEFASDSGRRSRPKKYKNQDDVVQTAIKTGELNLNDPELVNQILKKKPYGVQDSVIAFLTNPPPPKGVKNDSGYSEFFKDPIDSNLLYVLQNVKNEGNWDSRRAAGVTPQVIFDNLNHEVKAILSRIRNFDGSPLTQVQIFNMIGSRALDGTLKKLSIGYLQKLAEDSEKRVPVTITRSSSNQVNEVAALALIERNMFPLDPDALGSQRDAELIKNWKIVPSDVDMYVPFSVGGEVKRFYINDDETFIDRTTLSLKDGGYFDVLGGPVAGRLFSESEADHAFYIPESTRQKAIQILGGEAGRTLTVSADAATSFNIEYDSSLSSPRQPYYLLSGVLTTLQTQPSPKGLYNGVQAYGYYNS